MSDAAISVFVFGIYLLINGMGFLFIPNILLKLFKLPKTDEPWIRILGIVVVAIALYYLIGAQNELSLFFWATVIVRFWVLISLTLLILIKKAPPILIIYGIIDALGAIWTLMVS